MRSTPRLLGRSPAGPRQGILFRVGAVVNRVHDTGGKKGRPRSPLKVYAPRVRATLSEHALIHPMSNMRGIGARQPGLARTAVAPSRREEDRNLRTPRASAVSPVERTHRAVPTGEGCSSPHRPSEGPGSWVPNGRGSRNRAERPAENPRLFSQTVPLPATTLSDVVMPFTPFRTRATEKEACERSAGREHAPRAVAALTRANAVNLGAWTVPTPS